MAEDISKDIGKSQMVLPVEGMSLENFTQHINLRHTNPLVAAGLSKPLPTPESRPVWRAWHNAEHRLFDDHDHEHGGGEPQGNEE